MNALTPEQLRDFQDKGYCAVPRAFSADDVAALDQEAQRLLVREDLIHSNNIRCRWADHVDTGECRFDSFDPVTDIAPECARIARDCRIKERLWQIYDNPACLIKDKLIFKPPGAPGYPLHQDYIGWADFPRSFLTVMLAIDRCDAQSGAVEVFAGYHKQGSLAPEDGQFHRLPAGTVEAARGEILTLEPGDIAIFDGFTPHRSGPNLSGAGRRLLYLSYNSAADDGDLRETHYQQFHAWLKERYAEHGKFRTYFR
ncbi:MAG: phytanoyl-CoA dioxygenase family protein [Stenotrophobium sp.]